MIEFNMFILVSTSPLLEHITRDLEDVPWWTFRSLSQLNRRIKTSSFVFVLLSELTSLEREKEREILIDSIRFDSFDSLPTYLGIIPKKKSDEAKLYSTY